MDTYVHLWYYLAEFFLEWDLFQTVLVEQVKTYFMLNNFFFRKSRPLRDNVEKFGKARQSTNDNIIRRMRYVRCTSTATDTRSGYVILIAFPRQSSYTKAPTCYVIRRLLELFFLFTACLSLKCLEVIIKINIILFSIFTS
jgi:hypothetical protein